jgi:hypothetical protein
MLTDKQLDEIDARASAATPGTWNCIVSAGMPDDDRGPEIYFGWGATRDLTEADQKFIVAARQDVPALVAEIRRLKSACVTDTPETCAIPGQTPRPVLDAAFKVWEAQAALCKCGICGKEDPMLRWSGMALFDETGMSPYMCQDCGKKWPANDPNRQ